VGLRGRDEPKESVYGLRRVHPDSSHKHQVTVGYSGWNFDCEFGGVGERLRAEGWDLGPRRYLVYWGY
jgi:hypothetical protein